ncbi:hypothetical protein Ancab_034747 [Ancistrocladus abbreviatus]
MLLYVKPYYDTCEHMPAHWTGFWIFLSPNVLISEMDFINGSSVFQCIRCLRQTSAFASPGSASPANQNDRELWWIGRWAYGCPMCGGTWLALIALVTSPAYHKDLLSVVKSWPRTIYSALPVISAIEPQLKTSSVTDTLKEALAELYVIDGQYESAFSLFADLLKPDVFDFIEKHNLHDAINEKAMSMALQVGATTSFVSTTGALYLSVGGMLLDAIKAMLDGTSNIDSPVNSGSGEFLMNLAIGTPPESFAAIMDAGSDLIWTQCEPCTQCFSQRNPIYNPQDSSSFSQPPRSSQLCQA